MKVGYSVLREIHSKRHTPCAHDYGLSEVEFERFIKLLEKKGYLERILRNGDSYSIRNARLTSQGIDLLQELSDYEATYPEDRGRLKDWVNDEKMKYSNEAE